MGTGGDWIGAAVARYEGPLIVYAQRLVGDLSRARDVVQETFLRLCRTPRDEVENRLAAWLYTVCRNAAMDARRKERRMTLLNEQMTDRMPDSAPDPAATLETSESAARVLHMLGRLPESQREAIVLKFSHGLSYKEIAQITGHSVSNVGFLIHTGLKTMRELAVDAAR